MLLLSGPPKTTLKQNKTQPNKRPTNKQANKQTKSLESKPKTKQPKNPPNTTSKSWNRLKATFTQIVSYWVRHAWGSWPAKQTRAHITARREKKQLTGWRDG